MKLNNDSHSVLKTATHRLTFMINDIPPAANKTSPHFDKNRNSRLEFSTRRIQLFNLFSIIKFHFI